MTATFRIVSWNCHRANASRSSWEYLLALKPDIALLQEVSGVPDAVKQTYQLRAHAAVGGKASVPQRFMNVMLIRGDIESRIILPAPHAWIQAELNHFAGNLSAYSVVLHNGQRLNVVNVHSPAWPINSDRLNDVDVSPVRLKHQRRKIWVADLLWASLRERSFADGENWVVAGDFNLCETFDSWRGGPRGNREFLDRMAALGLVECLRTSQGQLTPTFRNTSGGAVRAQIDHMFVTPDLGQHLISCRTGVAEEVFGRLLSDHLPIIAEFRYATGKRDIRVERGPDPEAKALSNQVLSIATVAPIHAGSRKPSRALDAASSIHAATVEQPLGVARLHGTSRSLEKMLEVSTKVGLNARAWKTSIMFTPTTNKSRMLFTFWARPVGGKVKMCLSHATVAEFYETSAEQAATGLGADGYRYMEPEGVEDFSRLVGAFFLRLNERRSGFRVGAS